MVVTRLVTYHSVLSQGLQTFYAVAYWGEEEEEEEEFIYHK